MDMENRKSAHFENLENWILDQGLLDATVTEIVQGVGQRLVAGGFPINRLGIGGMILHPVVGAMDVVWEADSDHVRREMFPRELLMSEEFKNAPFFWMLEHQVPFLRQELDTGEAENEFPIYHRLRSMEVTDYFAFFQSFGRKKKIKWADLPTGIEGITGSFSTRRLGGFAEPEIDYLKALSRPLSLALKSSTTTELSHLLLDVYLGSYTGGQVHEGLIERGDGRVVNCVILFCDLRDSTRLADEIPLEEYLALLNEYFDCTAGAVIEHGGEVLKFIGDAVMAIFPIDETSRPEPDMCRASIMTARDALARADKRNVARIENGERPIEFAISLHVGEVMYGNIGTKRRLDFTVTGPAVNEAARLEGLSKVIGTPIVLSKQFKESHSDELVSLGIHETAGKPDGLEVFALPDLVPESKLAKNVETLVPKAK